MISPATVKRTEETFLAEAQTLGGATGEALKTPTYVWNSLFCSDLFSSLEISFDNSGNVVGRFGMCKARTRSSGGGQQ